ncbi:UNVERIFIED_ORG: hypothetical protein B2H98_06445 [Clostridium botulinum]
MKFSIGGLIDTVVGAVAKVATVIVNVLSPVAKSDGALGGIAGKIVGVAESVLGAIAEFGDACEDGNIDVDEDFEKILEEEFKLLVGAMLKEDWLRDPEGSMADFKNNINDLKNSDEVGNIIKRTDTFKWFKEKTQEGVLPEFFDIGGFDRDENGVYHAQQDALQKYGGYTDLYDDVFDLFCSMDKQKFDFEVGDEEYIIWLWKGDYLNLGTGAETGIYKGEEPLWECDTENAMPMTLRLEDTSGNVIYDWKPEENKWWYTGFNPAYSNQTYIVCQNGSVDILY